MRTGYEAEGPKMLQLLEADTWTLDFMESRPQTFPMADFSKTKYKVLDELSQGVRAQEFVQLMEQSDCANGFLYQKQLHVRSLTDAPILVNHPYRRLSR